MSCPSGFTVVGHSCLFLSTSLGYNPLHWLDAELSCQSMGATLVSMKTEDKFNEIRYYLEHLAPPMPDESNAIMILITLMTSCENQIARIYPGSLFDG